MSTIQVDFKQIADAVHQLSPDEKWELNELMWNDDMPIPIEHQELVMSRIAKAKENPERLLDWNEISKTL